MTQQYEELFDGVASNGTPRTKLDERFKRLAPELYAKIMDARAKGQKYNDGIFEYGITESEQHGPTVYKNKSRKATTATATGKSSYYNSPEFKQQQKQKTDDIKAAQLERRNQHRELIITMKNLTKVLVAQMAKQTGETPESLEDSLGFEQYREEQEIDSALDRAD